MKRSALPHCRVSSLLCGFIASLSLANLLFVVSVGIWATPAQARSRTFHTPAAANVSPLLFGTNLVLDKPSDPFITDSTLRTDLQQIHTQIIRMPARPGMDEKVVHQAAQLIHDMGLTPLVILGGASRANPLSDDKPVVQDMISIFGNSRVYYEFGNEEDLAGVKAPQYTTSWNNVVSQLKQLAPNAWFIGPVNYQYDGAYLRYFLQNANPRPDAVSWHMYTCDTSKDPRGDSCLNAIDNWPQHFSDARQAMHDTPGITTELPILITEWNYDPGSSTRQPQLNGNGSFIQQWTTKAIETMAKNNVFASMQYGAYNLTPLVSNDQLTTQATTFKTEFESLIGNSSSVPTSTPTPTSTATDTPTATSTSTSTATSTSGNYKFSFEDRGTDGWGQHGSIANVTNSSSVAKDGTNSLQVDIIGSNTDPYVSVSNSTIADISPNQTVTAYVYGPSGTTQVAATLFVQDQNYVWHKGSTVTLTAGQWNLLTLQVPSSIPEPATQLGIQFDCPSDSTVYIDAVNWS